MARPLKALHPHGESAVTAGWCMQNSALLFLTASPAVCVCLRAIVVVAC